MFDPNIITYILYGTGTLSVGLRDLGLEPGTILDSTLWLMEEIDCLDEDV